VKKELHFASDQATELKLRWGSFEGLQLQHLGCNKKFIYIFYLCK